MVSEHIAELKKWVSELARARGEGDFVRLNRAVELIAKNFGARPDEVAILGFTHDDRELRFLAPADLRTMGNIPLNHPESLAARTAREGRPEAINNFSIVPHMSAFERVPIAKRRRAEPIQKIMSAPIILGSRVVGVLQVSRKAGKTALAGPDFSPEQLRELSVVCEALAPCVIMCRES